jgi:para-aminobenzoate synthetase/4-amino-4-deoxychorismate lyase
MKSWHPLPADVYALVESTPGTVLLETSRAGAGTPVSRLFVSPTQIIEAANASEVRRLFEQIEGATRDGLFAAGFFTYECGQVFEPTTATRSGRLNHPLAWFGIFEREYRFDHSRGAFLDGDPPGLSGTKVARESDVLLDMTPEITEKQYAHNIDQIHEWIRAGDVYQLNYTIPLRGRISEGAADVYATLRRRQPVEYGAFVHWRAGRRILCFSPELFFRVEEIGQARQITTQPMKGTAPRGRTTVEDREVAEWLRNDAKNQSENVMIVDLIRSDLGRLCRFGTVHVENLFAVERYPTLWQMTSTVTGELRPDAEYYDIFRALFPCGSITGAPKVRAMQLLAKIESQARGVYTGAIGYFSRERSVFNVAIRTLDLDGENATMGVGGGIVIDSTAEAEFRECQLKAEFLTRLDEPFSLIETLLWRAGYPLLRLHLDRLMDSADYFGFPCDRREVETALMSVAAGFTDKQARKVRLLLDGDGRVRIEHEIVSDPADREGDGAGRVCIAEQQTDPRDRFLYHKTTHRQMYEGAFKAGREQGVVDVLFLNTRGEVTEGAIHNAFIEKDGRWITPPVPCGLLAGVYRRYMMETRGDIEERVVSLEDLQTADAIYLTNAVRGVRRVVLDENVKLR